MLSTGSKFKNNCSKLSTKSVAELRSYDSAEFFDNMVVDVRTAAYNKQCNTVRQFLVEEFGQRCNFSDNFVDKVIERINND